MVLIYGIPEDLHNWLAGKARAKNRTVSEEIVQALESHRARKPRPIVISKPIIAVEKVAA